MLHTIDKDLAVLLSIGAFISGCMWLAYVAVFYDTCSPRTFVLVTLVTSVVLSMRLSVPLLDYASPLVYALYLVIAWSALKRVTVPRRVARFFKL